MWTGTPVSGATAVAVAGDRVTFVGDDAGARALAGPDTRVVDVRGGLVLPGLVDAHAHLSSLGESLRILSLVGTRSAREIRSRVRDAQRSHPPGDWLVGHGWDQNDWETTGFPSWRDLEGTDDNPVCLERIDGHALWLNRSALDACGIARATPDPPGGRIVRDRDGAPTGVLVDEAMRLATRRIPPPSDAERDARLRLAIAECNRLGLVGVHDAGTTAAAAASLRRLGARGELTLNVYSMADSDDPSFARACLHSGKSSEFGGRLVIRSLKLHADGALGSRGAALLAAYSDDPGNVGLLVQSSDTLLAWTREAVHAGFQVATHAIGDRANRIILDVYERVLAEAHPNDARLRVEHCQILDPADLGRFSRLGVVASMQPTHATSDMPWAEDRLGRARLIGAYAWRTLLDSGAVLAFGSDFPVESVNPLWGLFAAVTRQDHDGNPAGGWLAAQRVTLDEALRAFTWGAAYASFDETEAGTIEAGKRADLTVLDRNILNAAPRAILDARVTHTVVRGAVVYSAD